MTKNIFSNGFIYEAVDDSKVQSLLLLPHFPVTGEHSFVEGQEVVEGEDYEKRFQVFISKWEDCEASQYQMMFNHSWRRIVAIPLPKPQEQALSKEFGVGEDMPTTHETFVIGFNDKGEVIFFKSYRYKEQKDEAQSDLKWVIDNCHHWELGAATEWKLTHEDICHDIIIPHP